MAAWQLLLNQCCSVVSCFQTYIKKYTDINRVTANVYCSCDFFVVKLFILIKLLKVLKGNETN